MKQIIPFEKEITFKTTIGEITGISLDHDLVLNSNNEITGCFYVKGTYKMLSTSELEEPYSFKIPCEINISDEYDTFDATIDIDDFNYEISSENILKIDIQVLIDHLEKKEIVIEGNSHEVLEELVRSESTINDNSITTSIKEEPKVEKVEPQITIEKKEEMKEPARNNFIELSTDETYLTYSVYLMKEEDTIEAIMKKYKVSYEELQNYNNLDQVMPNTKLIIPASK